MPAGVTLARSPDRQLELIRLTEPLRAAWLVTGVSGDGWLKSETPARIQLYALRGRAGRCAEVTVTLNLSAVLAGPQRATLAGDGVRSSVLLAPGTTRALAVRACGRASAPTLALSTRRTGDLLDPGLGPHLISVAVREL